MKFNFLVVILLAGLPGFLVASQAQVVQKQLTPVSTGYALALISDADLGIFRNEINRAGWCDYVAEHLITHDHDSYSFKFVSRPQQNGNAQFTLSYNAASGTPLDQYFPQERQRAFIERVGKQVIFTEKTKQKPIELTWQDTDTLYSISNSWPYYPQNNLKKRVNFRYPKTWFISWGKNHPYIVASIFTLVFGGLIAYKKWSTVKKLLKR